MARPRTPNPKTSQINVRITSEQMEELAAIEFVYGETPVDLTRRLLEDELHQRRDDPRLRAVLEIRRDARGEGERADNIVDMSDRRPR